jgi:phosphopantetheine adenylyltransferase/dephospho-CoA kinase
VLVIGVTGGICSGKSTVSRLLVDEVTNAEEASPLRGVLSDAVVVDADKLGHEAYRPGTSCHRAVVEAFGQDTVLVDGAGAEQSPWDREIDRRKLGALVFADPTALHRLEAIVWPEIRRLAERRISELAELHRSGPAADKWLLVVLEAAVMLPAGWCDIPDSVWFVRCSKETALGRLMARNGLGEADARMRLDRQVRSQEELAQVHVFIDNEGGEGGISGSGGGDASLLRSAVVKALWNELVARGAPLP